MFCEYHCHTEYSFDATVPMEMMVTMAMEKKCKEICFTDHIDYSCANQKTKSIIDYELYTKEFLRLRSKYSNNIKLKLGVEMGLEKMMENEINRFLSEFEFDFVIGSTHNINFADLATPLFYKGMTQNHYYEVYLNTLLTNVKMSSSYDVVGHLDYCLRYGPWKNKKLSWDKYGSLIEEILKKIICLGKGIEINTAGKRKGLCEFHPSQKILELYHDLGGEIITLGSDSHDGKTVCYRFDEAIAILKKIGFMYYSRFEKRKPLFEKIN